MPHRFKPRNIRPNSGRRKLRSDSLKDARIRELLSEIREEELATKRGSGAPIPDEGSGSSVVSSTDQPSNYFLLYRRDMNPLIDIEGRAKSTIPANVVRGGRIEGRI